MMTPHRSPLRLATLYIILLLIVLVAMALIYRCGGVREGVRYDEPIPSQGDTIDAAVIYGPSSYWLDGDTMRGANYERLLGLQQATGRTVRMHPVSDIGKALEGVKAGRYDLLASLPLDEDLRRDWTVSDSVYTDRLVVVSRTGGQAMPANVLGLEGDTVHVLAGSAAERRMNHLMAESGTAIALKPEHAMTEEYMALKVSSGEWDYAVVSEQVFAGMQRDTTRTLQRLPVSLTQRHVWVMRQGDTLLRNTVNRYLKK